MLLGCEPRYGDIARACVPCELVDARSSIEAMTYHMTTKATAYICIVKIGMGINRLVRSATCVHLACCSPLSYGGVQKMRAYGTRSSCVTTVLIYDINRGVIRGK